MRFSVKFCVLIILSIFVQDKMRFGNSNKFDCAQLLLSLQKIDKYNMKFLVCFLSAIGLFSSCNTLVVGSDTITVVERGVASYSAVSVEDGLNLIVSNTPKGSVSVKANENIHQYIQTSVEDHTLVVRVKRGLNLRKATISVTVSGEGIGSVEASGGARVEMNRCLLDEKMNIDLNGGSHLLGVMDIQTLDAEISGGSNVKIQGLPAKRIDLESSGGSVAELAIDAHDVNLEISGGGKAYVWVSNTLNLNLSGGSRVVYKGVGSIGTISSSGGSEVARQDW